MCSFNIVPTALGQKHPSSHVFTITSLRIYNRVSTHWFIKIFIKVQVDFELKHFFKVFEETVFLGNEDVYRMVIR